MYKNLYLARLVAMLVALAALAAFFLPYISATPGYRASMAYQAGDKPFEDVDITVGEIMDMSLYKYARMYFQGGNTFFGSLGTGILYGAIFSAVGVFALLTLLAAWRVRPIWTLVCDLLMCGAVYVVNWDFVDRGVMPHYTRVWGIAYQAYYPLAAVIAACAVCMFLVERRGGRIAR